MIDTELYPLGSRPSPSKKHDGLETRYGKTLPQRKPGPTLAALGGRIGGSRTAPGKRSGGGFIQSWPLARTGDGSAAGRRRTRNCQPVSKRVAATPLEERCKIACASYVEHWSMSVVRWFIILQIVGAAFSADAGGGARGLAARARGAHNAAFFVAAARTKPAARVPNLPRDTDRRGRQRRCDLGLRSQFAHPDDLAVGGDSRYARGAQTDGRSGIAYVG